MASWLGSTAQSSKTRAVPLCSALVRPTSNSVFSLGLLTKRDIEVLEHIQKRAADEGSQAQI